MVVEATAIVVAVGVAVVVAVVVAVEVVVVAVVVGVVVVVLVAGDPAQAVTISKLTHSQRIERGYVRPAKRSASTRTYSTSPSYITS